MIAHDERAGWAAPAAAPALGPDDVHVWQVSFAAPRAEVAALATTLRDDERQRAARFVFDRDRDAYTITRGTLRSLLGRYLGAAPGSIELGYRDKGKPYLRAPASDLRFNVSHSGERALLAFARGRELGVDIEQRRSLPDLLSLARVSFAPAEYAALCALPAAVHEQAFFACWSRKEAFIKATGEGVSQLDAFDVNLEPGQPPRILRIAGEPRPERWAISSLPAVPGYDAALVVEGGDVALTCWQW